MRFWLFGMQWDQLDHMQTICTSLQTDNHTNTLSLKFLQAAALPDAQPTVSKHCKARTNTHKYSFNKHWSLDPCLDILPSVLWHCWSGGRKGIRPVKKTEWWAAGMVICLERDADLHMAQLMPMPLTVSCFSKIQIGFAFLVPAHPGSPGQRAVKWVCVCVCVWSLDPFQTNLH